MIIHHCEHFTNKKIQLFSFICHLLIFFLFCTNKKIQFLFYLPSVNFFSIYFDKSRVILIPIDFDKLQISDFSVLTAITASKIKVSKKKK